MTYEELVQKIEDKFGIDIRYPEDLVALMEILMFLESDIITYMEQTADENAELRQEIDDLRRAA